MIIFICQQYLLYPPRKNEKNAKEKSEINAKIKRKNEYRTTQMKKTINTYKYIFCFFDYFIFFFLFVLKNYCGSLYLCLPRPIQNYKLLFMHSKKSNRAFILVIFIRDRTFLHKCWILDYDNNRHCPTKYKECSIN